MKDTSETDNGNVPTDDIVTRDEFNEATERLSVDIAKTRKLNTQLAERVDDLEAYIGDLETIIDEQRERIVELEAQLYPEIEEKEYDDLTRAEKVGIIRRALTQEARARKQMGDPALAKMEYSDVRVLFDGHASARHAYDLMEQAGNAPGYDYVETSGKNSPNTVRVDLDVASEGTVGSSRFVHRNKPTEEGGSN